MNPNFKKYTKLNNDELYQELRKTLKKQNTEAVLHLMTSTNLKKEFGTEEKIADFLSAYALENELNIQASDHQNRAKSIFIQAFMSGTKKQKSKAQEILEEEINNPGKATYSKAVEKALTDPIVKQIFEDYKNDDLFIVRNKVLNNIGAVVTAMRVNNETNNTLGKNQPKP